MSDKRCTKCETIKSLAAFSLNKRRNRPTTHQSWCKECMKDAQRAWYQTHGEVARQRNNERYAADPRAVRLATVRRKYNLTAQAYNSLILRQAGLCLGCWLTPNVWHVDHDHACCPGDNSCGGCVRGLLCGSCNAALGFAKDSTVVLSQLMEYLG